MMRGRTWDACPRSWTFRYPSENVEPANANAKDLNKIVLNKKVA